MLRSEAEAQVRPRLRWGRVLPSHGPPTFAALLDLARTRAMLLHLDIKEPGLEEDITELLDRADAWDHVVSVNTYNATNLLRHPKLKLLGYKAGLFDGRRDMDPATVRAALPGPGEMIIVDDPRVAARSLKRPKYQPVPLSKSLCVDLRPDVVPPPPLSKNLPFKPVETPSTASLNSPDKMGTRWNASLPGSGPLSASARTRGFPLQHSVSVL